MRNSTVISAFRVGEWTVEPELNQLSAPGRSVKLEPKATAVLVYLAERPGQVASREALLSSVWPGVVVGDDSLTQVVIKLRKALGDTSEKPEYIQTIPKGGYRLIAPVVRPGQVPARRGVARLAIAGLVLSLAAAGLWWWAAERDVATNPSAETAPSTQATIAIRPFEGLGNDAEADLLAQGITADLVTDLSKVPDLVVVDAASAGGKPGGAAPAPTLRYLVSGSVQRADDRLRLNVHLTDAQTGRQLWSERFDRPKSALFAIQEEIGPKILKALPAKVSEAELRRVAQRYTRNLEAYEHFQRGQAALLIRRKAENEVARTMFRRAIALDATFARAYAGLALTYAADYRNQWTADGAAALKRAFEMAQSAQQIDPDLPEAYWVLAFVHLERRQHELALRHLETAVALNPSFADAYALMGGIKTYVGNAGEAVPLLRKAMRLNPQAGHLYFLILGRAYFALGDLEQARVNLEQALSRNPENLEARIYMVALDVSAGDASAASWQAEQIRALQPGFSAPRWLQTNPLTDAAQKVKLLRALTQVGL